LTSDKEGSQSGPSQQPSANIRRAPAKRVRGCFSMVALVVPQDALPNECDDRLDDLVDREVPRVDHDSVVRGA
jgi:hypothetical protein